MENGVPTRLDAVAADKLGTKLRLAGQVLAYDAQTGMVLLWTRDVAVLVDASNCVSAWTTPEWLKEHLCTIETVGYLERAPPDLRVPALPEHFPLQPPKVDDGLVLRAVIVVARSDMSMELWKEAQAVHMYNGGRKAARGYPRFVVQLQ